MARLLLRRLRARTSNNLTVIVLMGHLLGPPVLQLHKAGRFPFERIITYYPSLEDINTAIADVSAGRVVKPVLRIH